MCLALDERCIFFRLSATNQRENKLLSFALMRMRCCVMAQWYYDVLHNRVVWLARVCRYLSVWREQNRQSRQLCCCSSSRSGKLYHAGQCNFSQYLFHVASFCLSCYAENRATAGSSVSGVVVEVFSPHSQFFSLTEVFCVCARGFFPWVCQTYSKLKTEDFFVRTVVNE